MSSLQNAFSKAVAVINDQRGKPAILGKSDGTLYWVDPSGMTHRTRVWARIGEQASNQEVVVDCLRASPQMDMPVRVDHVNGRLTVVDVDGQRAIEFGGGRPGATVSAHAWLHHRLGPDPVYIEGLQFLPLLVTPTSPPDLTVTVQAGAYTDSAGDLAIHDTAVSGSFSAFVPGTGHHFVIVCLDRTDGSIVLVDGSDVTVTDALFGDAVVTAADIEAVVISGDYKPLGVVLLYAAQTQIKARDIIKDLRTDSAAGSGLPAGTDGQIQYNNGGVFGGSGAYWDDATSRLGIGTAAPNVSLDVNGGIAARVSAVTIANGDNDNIDIGNGTWVRGTGPTAAFNISGFNGGANGRVLVFAVAVAQSMTIENNSAKSTAGNRIFTTTGADVVLGNVGKAIFIYDSSSSAWRMFMGNGSAGPV